MTIATDTAKSGPYAGNGSTTAFAYAFKVSDQAHLVVTETIVLTGVETTKTLTTHYTVSGVGDEGGGNVTAVAAPASTVTWTITRAVTLSQTTDLVNRASVNPSILELALDRAVQMIQDLDQQLDRTIKYPVSEDSANTPVVDAEAVRQGTVLGWDSDGLPSSAVVSGFGQLPSAASLTGLNMLRVNSGSTSYEEQTPTQVAASVAAVFANNAISGDKVEGGTIAAITISSATISGGAITGITDLLVADGGTGASTFTDGGVLLGSGTGAITAMGVLANSAMIVGDGSGDPVAESGATLRTSIGVGTGDSPQLTGIELGHASDTTIVRASAGEINVEGNRIFRAGGTDVPVADGGTGASTFTDGGVLLGSGTGAVTAMGVLANSAMIVGDGSGDPVAESGATLRTSIGVGTGDSPQLTGIELGHASDTTLVRASAGEITVEGNRIFRAGGTDIPVADGGSGASTFTDGGVLLGSGTGAITAMAVLANSAMIVGDGSGDPVAESGATLRTSIGVSIGSDVQAFGAVLDDFNTLDAASANGEIIVATGAGAFAYESGATLRTSVGVGTGDSPQLTGIELGHATDTTLTRASAGNLNIEGQLAYRAGGTDVPITDGGTGASNAADARSNLGVSAGGYVSGDTPDFDGLLLKGQKIQCFILQFKNNGGTIQHQIIARVQGTAAEFSDKINSASATYANTTTVDSSTAMTSGIGLLSGNTQLITFDTAAQTVTNYIGCATLERRSISADLTVDTGFVSRNINGATVIRLQFELYTNAGATFAINTTNIALNKTLAIRFTGYLA
jgi:hypothetical protein